MDRNVVRQADAARPPVSCASVLPAPPRLAALPVAALPVAALPVAALPVAALLLVAVLLVGCGTSSTSQRGDSNAASTTIAAPAADPCAGLPAGYGRLSHLPLELGLIATGRGSSLFGKALVCADGSSPVGKRVGDVGLPSAYRPIGELVMGPDRAIDRWVVMCPGEDPVTLFMSIYREGPRCAPHGFRFLPTAAGLAVAPPPPKRPSARAATNRPAPISPAPPVKPTSAKVWRQRIHDDDVTVGPANAPVKLVVFTAFGCPRCAEFVAIARRAVARYAGKVQLRLKHKAIPEQVGGGLLAGEASVCAHKQGKFWPMHDALVGAASGGYTESGVAELAAKVGLSMADYRGCMKRRDGWFVVARDSVAANATGSHSFPNILANGVRIKTPKNEANLDALIRDRLPVAERALASGVAPDRLYAHLTAGGKEFAQTGSLPRLLNLVGAASIGPASAPITITVFSDFQCPFCAKLAPKLRALSRALPQRVRIVIKHMPLASIHAHAQLAAEAAKEAQRQGRFWRYHELLYANQGDLSRAALERYAAQVGMNVKRLQHALDRRTHRAAVQADFDEAVALKLTGTPSVIVNGSRYLGPRGYPITGLLGVAIEGVR